MMKANVVPGLSRLYRLDTRGEKDIDCICDTWSQTSQQKLKKEGFVTFGNNLPWKKDFVKCYNGKLLRLDIHIGGYECADARVIVASKMLEPERQIYLFFYKSIAKKNLAKYETHIWACWKNADKKILLQHLSTTFKNATEIVRGLEKKKLVAPRFNALHQFRRVGCTIRNYTFKVLQCMHSVFIPAPYVAIIGTDGSGKTTAVNETYEQFTSTGFQVKKILGGRFSFQILPLNWLVKGVNKTKGKGKDTVAYKSKILPFIVPIVYYVEYALRYLFIVFPSRRKYDLVLADRSFLDVAISPNTNTRLSIFTYALLPQPKTIYLYNTLAIIAKRRPQHPRKDLEQQQKTYEKYQHVYFTQIRTTSKQSSEQVINSILQ